MNGGGRDGTWPLTRLGLSLSLILTRGRPPNEITGLLMRLMKRRRIKEEEKRKKEGKQANEDSSWLN